MENLEDIIIDEIALEGLNGVSLSRLWTLLEQRKPPFPLRCDQHTKDFLWEGLLSRHGSIAFYEVPAKFVQTAEMIAEEETEPAKKRKSSKVSKEESDEMKEMMIDDPDTKEKGYCPCYKERSNVTEIIRSDSTAKGLSLQGVTDRWGERLVLVASQERRLKSLLSSVKTPDLSLVTSMYCTLERIGRARHAGVSQVTVAELFKWDIRTVFHFCKILMRRGLVIKEKTETGVSIYLLRFMTSPRQNIKIKVGQIITDCLVGQPDNMILRRKLLDFAQACDDQVTFRHLKKSLAHLKSENVVESMRLPLHEVPAALRDGMLDPEDEEEANTVTKRKVDKNKVNPRCVQVVLIKLVGQPKENDKKDADDDDDDDFDNGDFEDFPISEENEYPNQHMNIQQPDHQQIYNYIDKHQFESRGKAIMDLRRHFGLHKYRVRLVIKRLVRAGLLVSLLMDRGRQREQRFFTRRGLECETLPQDLQTFYDKLKGKDSPLVDSTQIAKKQKPSEREATLEDAGTSTSASSAEVAMVTGDENQSRTTPAGEETQSPAKCPKQTLTSIKRREMVLKHLAQVKVTELFEVTKHIREREAAEKLTVSCCRKTVFRLINNLHEEKKLKFFMKKAPSTDRRGTQVVKIIAAAELADDDPLIETTVRNALMRPIFKVKKAEPAAARRPKPKVKKAPKPRAPGRNVAYNTMEMRKIMELYGYAGKFFRAEVLHKFLWYLIYGHDQKDPVRMEAVDNKEYAEYSVSQTNSGGGREQAEQTDKENGKRESLITDPTSGTAESQSCETDKAGKAKAQAKSTNMEFCERLQTIREGSHTQIGVYVDTSDPSDWRRYVPPAQFQKGRIRGWATMNDIIFSLPLSLFVNLVSMSRMVPGLEEVLQHPTKRHYPITHLPPFLIEELCDLRLKTITSIHRSLLLLSCMGLVYFSSPQLNQGKTMANFFLCPSGFYLDTTSSAAGSEQTEVKEYPSRTYAFTSREAVDLYWVDLRMTCLSTPLGLFLKKHTLDKEERKTGARKNEPQKPLSSMCMVARSQEDPPPPPAQIPGDGRGAAGLDSSQFAFRPSNWAKVVCKRIVNRNTKVKNEAHPGENNHNEDILEEDGVSGVLVIKVPAKQHKQATAGGKGQKRKRAPRDDGPESVRPKAARSGGSIGAGGSKKKAAKSAAGFKLPRGIVRNKHIIDRVDLEASQKKAQMRVKWSVREDNLIILCSLAQRILKEHTSSVDSIKLFVKWTVIRDMLQERLAESQDKTASSVSRRFRVLMKNQLNETNFSVWLTDLTADKSFMAALPPKDGDYENPELCEKIFRSLCMQIHKRFEMHNKKGMLDLPASLHELYEQYDIIPSSAPPAMNYSDLLSCDVSSDQDITMCILVKIVLVAMLSHHYKQRDMKELYYVLQQYDPHLLQQAVHKFKRDGFLGRNRTVEHESLNKIRAMHTVPMSFQFTKAFFNLLDSPSVPSSAADEAVSLLNALLQAFHRESQKSHGDVSLTMDLAEGNLVTLFGLITLSVIDDSITIPENLLSLDLSANDIKELEKRHEEEMQKDSESADSEDEDSVGDGQRDVANLRKAREKEMDSDAEVSHSTEKEMKRKYRSTTGRTSIALIQRAHKAWSKKHEERTGGQPQTSQGRMASLIPRLLNSQKGKQVEDSGSMTEVEVISKGSAEDEDGETAPHALFLDHDYSVPPAKVSTSGCGEGSRDRDQAGTVAMEMKGDSSTSSLPVCAPPEQNLEREEMSWNSADTLQDEAEHPVLKSDSFFTWLTMVGLQTEAFSKKPQSIHEELRVKTCSLVMTPSPAFIADIQQLLVNQTEQASPHSIRKASRESPEPQSTDQPALARESSHDPLGCRRPTPVSRNVAHLKENITEQTERPFQTLAEVIASPCEPLQAFAPTNWRRSLLPREDYCIREPKKSLEEVSRGHQHRKLMHFVYSLIRNVGRFGMTLNKLLMASGQHWPQGKDRVLQCLRLLVREQLVIEVGTTVLRLVALEHASSWLVKCVRKTSPVLQQTMSHQVSQHSPKRQKLMEPLIGARGDSNLHREKEGRVIESSVLVVQEVTSADNCNSMRGRNVRLGTSEREGEEIPESPDSNRNVKPPADERDQSAEVKDGKEPEESSTSVHRGVGNAMIGGGGDQGSCARDVETSHVASGEERGNPSSSLSHMEGTARKRAELTADLPTLSELPLHESQQRVTFVGHIWTNINGSVNNKSLSMMATSVALLILSKPGIKETDVFHHFSKVMDPVECLHLIKILLNADVISRHRTFSRGRATLFRQLSGTKPAPAPFYHPTAQALTNLALLRENLLKPV